MNMAAFLGKLKELKVKMAELENMEENLPDSSPEIAEEEKLENKVDQLVTTEEAEKDPELGEEEVLSLFGKKKKEAPKAGMKVAFAQKPKAKMGKYK